MEITVIIPLFNKRSTVARALESVYSQLYSPSEIIIVDDGSTDESYQIAEEVIKRHSEIPARIIRTENCGVSAARNTGVSHASSSFVAFLDADDIWFDGHLNYLAELIEKFPGYGLYVSKRVAKNDAGSCAMSAKKFIQKYSRVMSIVHTSACAMNKNVFTEVGGFPVRNSKRGQDIVLWVRAGASRGAAFTNVVTSFQDLQESGIAQRRSTLPSSVYHLYPDLTRFPSECRDAIRKIVRKNIVLSLVASWPIDEALIERVILDVGLYDRLFARVIVISMRIGIFDVLVGLRRTVKRFRSGRPL